MTILRWHKPMYRQFFKKRPFSTSIADSEYTETPQYPPILDLSFEKRLERKAEAKHEEIKNVKTVEEKQIKLNMPKYYGFKTHVLYEDSIKYNNLPLSQHVTRTHIIETDDMPKYYENIGINNTMVNSLKDEVTDALVLEVEGYRKMHDLRKSDLTQNEIEDIIGSSIIKQLNRVIINNLSKSYSHLKDIQIDYEPRIESCWNAGGMLPPERVKSYRRGMEWMKPFENEPVDRIMTYIGNPYMTLRAKLPLSVVMPEEECKASTFEVPFWQYDPRVVGIAAEYRRIVNIPGFWPGDKHRFGTLQYLKRGHHLNGRFAEFEATKTSLHRQAILASFAWLNAQANNLGFTTFNDITYPLISQTVITNGQLFSFYTYQMNTLLLHSKNTKENPKVNVCYATDELKLYEKIKDGKLDGFNEDVMGKLVKFYANTPSERVGVELTPFLSADEKIAADYEDQEKREWLEREFKFITSNRPRQHLMDEIYAWEKIYKIDHNTRFMDKKLRPFELRKKITDRTYDDRKPKYIPRKLRPDLPRHKGRNAKEFFP